MGHDFWFTSTLFTITSDEGKETNPGCYGKELGSWLCKKLQVKGYSQAELIPEDWGWCVICSNDTFFLWVGCGAVTEQDFENSMLAPSKPEEIIWHVFSSVEVPFFRIATLAKKLVGKLNTQKGLEKLHQEIEEILKEEPQISLCEQPEKNGR